MKDDTILRLGVINDIEGKKYWCWRLKITKVDKSLDVLGPGVLHEGGSSVEADFLAIIDVENDIVLNGVVDEVTNHLCERYDGKVKKVSVN